MSHREKTPGPMQVQLVDAGRRLVLEPFPVPPLVSFFVAMLGACVLMMIPWAIKGWRLPIGGSGYFVLVPAEAVTYVVALALVAGSALVSFGLAGVWQL